MDRIEYNIRVILSLTIIILASILLTFILIREGRDLGWFKKNFETFRIITIVSGICVSMLFVGYMFFSISYKEAVLENLEVVNIVHRGSLWGLMDTQALLLKSNNGDIIRVQTILGSSKDLYNSIENLKVGDKINIKYVAGVNNLYYVEHSDNLLHNLPTN